MEDALWKLTGFLLAAVLIIAVPTMSMLERQDDVTRALVQAEANRFADTARDMGAISPALYERLQERLRATGMLYDIRIRHESHAWMPILTTTATGLTDTGTFGMSTVTEGEMKILSVLYPDASMPESNSERLYRMHAGDLLFVEVASRGETLAGAWRHMFLPGRGSGIAILARAGGMVRNETD